MADVRALRLDVRVPDPPGRPRRKDHRGEFLASIPWSWLATAAKLPGHTLQVAIAIRHQAALERNTTIVLQARWQAELGFGRHTERRALLALVEARLVRVQQRRGGRPRITVVDDGGEP